MNSEKIWRISSLTAAIDDQTKLLVLPIPESKRAVKIADTVYKLTTYEDLVNNSKIANDGLQVTGDEIKRFQDKTQEEIA